MNEASALGAKSDKGARLSSLNGFRASRDGGNDSCSLHASHHCHHCLNLLFFPFFLSASTRLTSVSVAPRILEGQPIAHGAAEMEGLIKMSQEGGQLGDGPGVRVEGGMGF